MSETREIRTPLEKMEKRWEDARQQTWKEQDMVRQLKADAVVLAALYDEIKDERDALMGALIKAGRSDGPGI